MSWRVRRRAKEEMAEDRCFTCKDGGDLRVCDFEDCLKAYHPRCAGSGDGFLSPNEQFICDWHICVQCRGPSDYQCLCCPLYSVCHACLGKVEFVHLRKQNKGLCSSCLDLAISIEKNADGDPHLAKTDYRDAELYVRLFKDYWEGIQDREHLTLVDLEEASALLIRRLNCKEGANSEKFADDDYNSNGNIFADNDANDEKVPLDSKCKQNKANTLLKNKSNKRTYVGWGSEELIEFLSSFGKDTEKPLDKVEIVGIVKGYIKQKSLYQDGKKRCFLCDDMLRPLFKRRKVSCKMISKFLSVHLASNAVSDGSKDDDAPVLKKKPRNSEDHDAPVVKKKPQNSLLLKVAKRVSERSKRCFASLIQNNINLIYLRRTLVVSLLSHPDTFEHKVVGCFVRFKTNPRGELFQMCKRAYQLGLVTGINKSTKEYQIKEDTCTNILLCVTGLYEDVEISMLSDEDFTEDECSDLNSLVKKGLLKRVTAELEEKVAAIHTDIVNHWIERELVRLERGIDKAHINGLHIQMEELLHRKKLLSTPAERQRLLEQVPEIVPDTEYEEKEIELEVAAISSSQENRGAGDQATDSLNNLNEESLEGATHQVVDSLNVLDGEPSKGAIEQISDSLNLLHRESSKVAFKQGDATREATSEAGEACYTGVAPDPALHCQTHDTQDDNPTQAMNTDQDGTDHSRKAVTPKISDVEVINLDSDEDEDLPTVQDKPDGRVVYAPWAMNGGDLHIQRSKLASPAALLAQGAMNRVNLKQCEAAPGTVNGAPPTEQCKPPAAMEQHEPAHAAKKNGVSPLAPLWYYVDPQGDTRGPFPLMDLLRWKQNGFFDAGFRVWKTGQGMEQAILLTDALRVNP
ncbi:hypothetical protein BS78_03G359700 [Paspalum vaginatum]|nr:hypothetical protein BS78_03G359700 [Paspalum vaginatum]